MGKNHSVVTANQAVFSQYIISDSFIVKLVALSPFLCSSRELHNTCFPTRNKDLFFLFYFMQRTSILLAQVER